MQWVSWQELCWSCCNGWALKVVCRMEIEMKIKEKQEIEECSCGCSRQEKDIKVAGEEEAREAKPEQSVECYGNHGTEYPEVGIKWTKQRKCVYQILGESAEPLNAVQIYNRIPMESREGNFAVSTIYRILTAFEEKGLVSREHFLGDGTVCYTLNRGGHTHYAICLGCHKRIPLKSCPFSHMHLDTEEGFTVTGHKLELYGYCENCRKRLGR